MKENELKELEKFAKSFLNLAVNEPTQVADKIKEGIERNSIVPAHLLRELEENWNKRSFIPLVNVKEGEFAYHVELEMPGIKKEDINIEFKDNKLIVSGEKKHEKRTENDKYTRVESMFGSFSRSFDISEVDKENISANMADGILEIVLPKIKKVEKKIEIK